MKQMYIENKVIISNTFKYNNLYIPSHIHPKNREKILNSLIST